MTCLSVIIVNWNAGDFLLRCLASLRQGLAGLTPLSEVVLVDNASRELPVAKITQDWPSLRLIRNRTNLGFAAGCNQGIRASHGRWVLLLNPDSELSPGAGEKMLEFAEQRPAAGAVGPMLLDGAGGYQVSHASHPTLSSELRRMLHLDFPRRLDCPPEGREVEVEILQGACLLLRKQALDEVGLFDERFFMYSEEMDFCRRLKQAGWELFWLPEATVVHHGAVSTSQARRDMFLELYRSKVLYFRKHHGPLKGTAYKLILFCTGLLRLLLFPVSLVQRDPGRSEGMALARRYGALLKALASF